MADARQASHREGSIVWNANFVPTISPLKRNTPASAESLEFTAPVQALWVGQASAGKASDWIRLATYRAWPSHSSRCQWQTAPGCCVNAQIPFRWASLVEIVAPERTSSPFPPKGREGMFSLSKVEPFRKVGTLWPAAAGLAASAAVKLGLDEGESWIAIYGKIKIMPVKVIPATLW